MAYVACGRFTGWWELGLHPVCGEWDQWICSGTLPLDRFSLRRLEAESRAASESPTPFAYGSALCYHKSRSLIAWPPTVSFTMNLWMLLTSARETSSRTPIKCRCPLPLLDTRDMSILIDSLSLHFQNAYILFKNHVYCFVIAWIRVQQTKVRSFFQKKHLWTSFLRHSTSFSSHCRGEQRMECSIPIGMINRRMIKSE